MRLPIGEYIRQLRRQKGLNQTELGGTHFSKSYVSAVERGQITPSEDTLRFFAEQLDQSFEFLEQMLTQSQESHAVSAQVDFNQEQLDEQHDQEVVSLLDFVLQGKRPNNLTLLARSADFSLDLTIAATLQKQGRYAFLKGIIEQENADFSRAQSTLEYALALAPDEYKSAILDALGTNAYKMQAYEQALAFYQRARLLYCQQEHSLDLLFQIEMHCGNACCALSSHQAASVYYEQARKRLRPTHNMQIAGQLYLGLGYCLYAALYQTTKNKSSTLIVELSSEQVEQRFQQVLSFLLQSRTLYQVSSDRQGEIQARLTQAMILLDLCAWRQQQALNKHHDQSQPLSINCTLLLDQIDEQCHQVLLAFAEKYQQELTPTPIEQDVQVAYSALAYLIRSLSSRATVARLGHYTDTATRERSLSYGLCQKVLNSLDTTLFPWDLINDAIQISGHNATAELQAVLKLPDPLFAEKSLHIQSLALIEVYFAASEISEELGRATLSLDFAQEYYAVADRCFLFTSSLSFDLFSLAITITPYDSSYLVRLYQRYTSVFEQRLKSVYREEEATQTLLTLLKIIVLQLQKSILPESVEKALLL